VLVAGMAEAERAAEAPACAAGTSQAPYAGLSEGDTRLSKRLVGAGLVQPAACPPALAALLEACLAAKPAERPPASKIAAELRAALGGTWGSRLLWAWPGFC
jgi:hypothetical protein